MAKNYVIDGGTGELDVGGNTLANRFDLPDKMVPQNLGQRYNIGGLVRQNYDKAGAVKQAIETDWPKLSLTDASKALISKEKLNMLLFKL